MPSSDPVTHQHIAELFQSQNEKFESFTDNVNNKLGSLERQMEKVAEVLIRMAVLEERRIQDRQTMERLSDDVKKLENTVKEVKEVQNKKHPAYDEMLDSYTQFKRAVIVFLCSGILGAALLFGTVKFPAK